MTVTWDDVSARLGRNDLPATLVENFHDMTHRDQCRGIAEAWVSAEWPTRIMDPEVWLFLFERTLDPGQYLTDCGIVLDNSHQPDTLTLWRGSYPEFKMGMSWTTDKEKGEWFAHRLDHGEHIGELYEARVDVALVLASFETRGESEIVIDVDQLLDDEVRCLVNL
jgi:hypothetical protein